MQLATTGLIARNIDAICGKCNWRLVISIIGLLLVGFLLSLALMIGGAQSQEPALKRPNQPAEAAKNTAAQQRGSQNLPLVVDVIPPSVLKVETSEHPDKEKEKAFHEATLAYSTLALAVVTLFLASFTLGLMVFTLKLWRATKTLVEDAKDTAKKQLRAYLGVSASGITPLTKTHIQAFVEIRNTGSTPAHKAIQTIKAEIRNASDIGKFPPQETDRGSHVIVPGSHITIRFDLDNIGESAIQEIKDRKKSIFVWGSVSYVDIFGEKQSLEFRYRDLAEIYESNPDGPDYLVGWELRPEEDGNKST